MKHVLREAHFCADALAKAGCDGDLEYEVDREPPQFLRHKLDADCRCPPGGGPKGFYSTAPWVSVFQFIMSPKKRSWLEEASSRSFIWHYRC